MQLYLVRHAQSTNNLLWDTTGASTGRSYDPEITAAGRRQAQLVAQFLARKQPGTVGDGRDYNNHAGFGITHLYTSLMLRAAETASCIADALNMPLMPWEDIHETGGLYLEDPTTGERVGQQGSDRATLLRRFPRLVLPPAYALDGWWSRPFEEYDRALERARRVYGCLMEQHGKTNDRVALVTHGGFYHCLLQTIFKIGEPAVWLSMNNTGVTRIDFADDLIRLAYANRVDFLPPDLVT